MLYDNAQLARVYVHAWQVTGDQFFRTIVEETLDYVMREMTYVGAGANEGYAGGIAFYSTQDADSEGEEGRFFVWTPDEIREVLGEEADAFIEAYAVKPGGNASTGSAHGFEDKNILEFVVDMNQRATLAEARRKLFEAREERVRPGRDDVQLAQAPTAKVLTSWNGLMLAAFAEAARAPNRADYQDIAERNADFLLRERRQEDGRLLRTWKASPVGTEGPGEANLNGYLEDYSHLIEGLLELQTTFNPRWLVAAQELAEKMLEHFADSDGTLYDTSDDHEILITRPRGVQDNATPSGNAMAVTALLKLAGLTNELRYVDVAREALAQMESMMAQYPLGFGQWLQALSYTLAKPKEIAIIGRRQKAETQAMLRVAAENYQPFQVIALGNPDTVTPVVPLLQDRRQIDGRATAYVCVGFSCRVPVTEPEALQSLLETP